MRCASCAMVFSSVSGDSGCGEMLGLEIFHWHEDWMNCPTILCGRAIAWRGEDFCGPGVVINEASSVRFEQT